MLKFRTLAFATILIVASTLAAPTQARQTSAGGAPPIPAADSADVATVDAITAAVYASISGEKGVPRQWDRFRSLFAPDARLIPTRVTPNGNSITPMSIETYISRANDFFLENGFLEKEIYRKTERYGAIAHHFSTYESYYSVGDEEPFARGINSFQLVHDGKRWWIVTIFWQGESAGYPIPRTYLPG